VGELVDDVGQFGYMVGVLGARHGLNGAAG
jgi:hypothetical protein